MTRLYQSVAEAGGPRLQPDPGRVITRSFVPGDESLDRPNHLERVVARVLAFDDGTVKQLLADVVERYGDRHRGLDEVFVSHFGIAESCLPEGAELSDDRARLLGAFLTEEYAVEAAGLTNPSVVPAPDQSPAGEGQLAFVMSVRCIGEDHVSSIGFRTGVVSADGRVGLDASSAPAEVGRPTRASFPRSSLIHDPDPGEDARVLAFLMSRLPDVVTDEDLDSAVAAMPHRLAIQPGSHATVARVRELASACYTVGFAPGLPPQSRILWPNSALELHGMEDARFVRFTGEDGEVGYLGTYTAFDGTSASCHLLETDDFQGFRVRRLVGPAAQHKGMALFPRPIRGVRYALCRPDLESLVLVDSLDGIVWDSARTVRRPVYGWEAIQSGNCGSPIETEEGWLVVTHGVGPMREYSLGAVLLDLHDPCVVRAELPVPLLVPEPDERDGYAPNVVYSCGSLVHAGMLVTPYGFTDRGIDFAHIPLGELLGRMRTVTGA
jgi:predicted GH43/DUF377 family glycosyl hydrolase